MQTQPGLQRGEEGFLRCSALPCKAFVPGGAALVGCLCISGCL